MIFETIMNKYGYTYNDGGRSKAGYKGTCGDCGVRAISIAIGIPYKEAYKLCAEENQKWGFKKSARNGMMKDVYDKILNQLGWSWVSAPKFYGRKAYCYDLPNGTYIARQAGHYVAVINQLPNDIWDSSEKMVYGYWEKQTD